MTVAGTVQTVSSKFTSHDIPWYSIGIYLGAITYNNIVNDDKNNNYYSKTLLQDHAKQS